MWEGGRGPTKGADFLERKDTEGWEIIPVYDTKYFMSEEVEYEYYAWKDENPTGAAPRKENGMSKFTSFIEQKHFL